MPFFAVFNDNISHESMIWKNSSHPMLVNSDTVPIPGYFPDIPVVRKDVGRKHSNVEELDAHIGAKLARLESEGLLDKTIIFFWSDHGGPLLRQKRAVGNSGMRVPLIVRFPDKRMAGTINNQIVSLMDLGPTVLSLAGIEPPAYMQGKAFLGPYSAAPRTYHFGSADRFDESRDYSRSALDGRYVYIKNLRTDVPLVYSNVYREQIEMTSTLITMDKNGQLSGDAAYIFMKTKPAEELYDLVTDPWEVHNLAADPAYEEKLVELRQALNQWIAEVGDKGVVPELDLVESMWPGKIQPKTLNVQFSKDSFGDLVLSSTTPGASIAYQKGAEIGKAHWNLYSGPVKVNGGEKVAARAIRIGYKTSDISNYTNPATGVEEVENANGEVFTVFPNPASSRVNFQFYIPVQGMVDLIISDSNGREILKNARHFSQGVNLWEQNLNNNFIAGVYHFRLLAEGKPISDKLCVLVPEP